MAAIQTLSRFPRVLSIQSHVVHGFAGNRSVVLPLQLNDFEVDNINTVQKCNHSGYLRAGGQFTGTVLSIQDFKDIIY
jgi:pyridoxine kinase